MSQMCRLSLGLHRTTSGIRITQPTFSLCLLSKTADRHPQVFAELQQKWISQRRTQDLRLPWKLMLKTTFRVLYWDRERQRTESLNISLKNRSRLPSQEIATYFCAQRQPIGISLGKLSIRRFAFYLSQDALSPIWIKSHSDPLKPSVLVKLA